MQYKEMSDIMNNKLFWEFNILKTALLIKLSNIAKSDFLGSVTSEAYNIIGKKNDFNNSTQTRSESEDFVLQYKALKVP